MPAPASRSRADAQSRSRALQQEIIDLIHARHLHPGDPMPTEFELVEALGVGRNTVREALKVLQATGIVDVRHGYGMFVAEAGLSAVSVPLEFHARLSLRSAGHEALELVDVRQALESGLIGTAMKAMTPADLEALRAAVEDMEEAAGAGRPLTEADHRFHSAIFAPLGNGLLSHLLEAFWRAYTRLHEELEDEHSRLGEDGAAALSGTASAHRRIYEAVAAGDAENAARLMERHFDGIRSRITRHVADRAATDGESPA